MKNEKCIPHQGTGGGCSQPFRGAMPEYGKSGKPLQGWKEGI